MSWMDSWSRPSKSSAIPPPLYSTQGAAAKYCHSCGRVMSPHQIKNNEERKYCSSKCKSHKPTPLDRRLESAFCFLLSGATTFEDSEIPGRLLERRTKPYKGEPRIIIPCSVVEELVFGSRSDPEKVFGRKKNRASRVIGDEEGSDEDPYEKKDELITFTANGFAGKVRPPQHLTDVNGGIGGEKGRAEKGEETEEAERRRKEGLRVTEEKERVKRAARRGVVFGFVVEDGKVGDDGEKKRRKCEAIMNGKVVEPSFAKGDWGIRWRE